jgi:ZIP family zinc transporter
MSFGQISVLGAIAGATIFLGLPLGRLRTPMPRLKTALNATATGILIFLFWDVTSHAWAPIDEALSGHNLGHAARNGTVLAVALGVGLRAPRHSIRSRYRCGATPPAGSR